MVFCKTFKTLIKYPIILVIILLCSCAEEEKKPVSSIISDKEMIDLLADLHLADALGKERIIDYNGTTEVKTAQLNTILKAHNLSKEQFDQAMRDYIQDPESFYEFYEKVVNELNERLTRVEFKHKALKDSLKQLESN